MNRIKATFSSLQKKGEKALIGYVTAGDPDLKTSMEIIHTMIDSGIDILELGVPFSDPSADGPVIQQACKRALKSNVTLEDVLEMAGKIRETSQIPIIIFTYYNPVFAMGVQIFCQKALKNSVDGVLIVDLPFEESDEILRFKETKKLCLIRLIAPLTPYKRMKMITRSASGFIYLISTTGITGSAGLDTKKTSLIAENLRSATSLPICTGFGISTPDHVRKVADFSNGVVIGSAFEKIIEDNLENPELLEILKQATIKFKQATRIG
ncbi:MAG: tryptophan synthase subunit alpha [Desulfobacula sp.]|nr:tryptophan synthase subunit alpha [Desulfobacula sp.]